MGYPDRFSNDVIPRLGGMHSLVSFVKFSATLMENSGLSNVMTDVFGGMNEMLIGKKFPQNLFAVGMLAEEMIRYYFAAGRVHYARHYTCYLRSMEALPPDVLSRFMGGEHVMRHQR
ncbi:hypothetical protein HOLleu_32731 [Holothuria leucospilota]|uniref:Uncharacterized protein n=1 Tax=Holothuria leucospilota TaxID=206669 RepID=A0A9Q1BJ94_HOLLE|nr:hypothetical protein HOLleu_32731 [Holothuria leucospilota]